MCLSRKDTEGWKRREKREGHKGIPAGEEEDERVSVESLGKPEAYFFSCIADMLLLHNIYLLLPFPAIFLALASDVVLHSSLVTSPRLPAPPSKPAGKNS